MNASYMKCLTFMQNSFSCIASFWQNVQNIGTLPQGTSPPKPPRAHELKLLMKNIKATLTSQSTAGKTTFLLFFPLPSSSLPALFLHQVMMKMLLV